MLETLVADPEKPSFSRILLLGPASFWVSSLLAREYLRIFPRLNVVKGHTLSLGGPRE